jgi:hypothetical protein
MAKKVQYTTNTPSSTTDYLAADNTWKPMTGGGGGVPYTGATSNVDLGEFELKAGQLELDQTPTGTAGVAVMRWNNTDGTVDLGLKGGNVTLQIGQEQVIRVVNKTGNNLLESQYKVVRVRRSSEGGAQGQRLAVLLAQADTKSNHSDILGIVTENINNNQEGFITSEGFVNSINTSGSLQGETWSDGDTLYLSETVAGGLTNIQPTTHPVQIGYVTYAHSNNGKIYVNISSGADELDELHDVAITTPSNGQVLTYNSTTDLWENSTPSTPVSRSFLGVNQNGTIALSGTTYGSFIYSGFNASESARIFVVPYACTMKNFYVRIFSAQSATGSLVFTLRNNAADTSVVTTIAAGSAAGTEANSGATSASFVAGDNCAIKVQNNATVLSATVNNTSIMVEI